MSLRTSNNIGGTLKLLVDSGIASSFEEAETRLDKYELHVVVGGDIPDESAWAAAVLTVVNTGQRAFRGGVKVYLDRDVELEFLWGSPGTLSQAIGSYGGLTVDDELPDDGVVIVIGSPIRNVTGRLVVYATWSGWSGGVVTTRDERVDESKGNALSAILSASLAVSECFQNVLGNPVAGRRDVGVSLWEVDADWRSQTHVDPFALLPKSLWILGLGHLGQAYCWVLGFLPYPASQPPRLILQDVDRVDLSNLDTAVLATRENLDTMKTRMCSGALESLGFKTSLIERRFDGSGTRSPDEPMIALAGFDNHEARRHLEEFGFGMIVDVGLGSGPVNYSNILLHTFPSDRLAKAIFVEGDSYASNGGTAYEMEIANWIHEGESEEATRCGMVEMAGKSVGAAFVGVTAACLAIAEVLRSLHHGQRSSVLSLSLGDPQYPARSVAKEHLAIADVVYLDD